MGSPFSSIGVIGALVAALGLYGLLFMPGCNGYGYAGYGGYHSTPSFWYWGGVPTYHEPSVRTGSRDGPGVRGGGSAAGK